MPEQGLWLPDGTFQPFDKQALTTELATRQNAGDFWGFIDNAFGILPDPDPILRNVPDYARVLDDLAADDQVTMAMINRKNRVLNHQNHSFSAGAEGKKEPDSKARRLYDELVRDQENWTMQDVLSGILEAPFYGFVPLELMWRYESNWWHLVDVVAKPQEWFGFNLDNKPVWRGADMLTATPINPCKIILSRHYPTYKNPYGLRLLSRCLWPVAFKKGGTQFYVNFVEKYGMPWAVGTAPAKAKREEKRQMAADLARMVQDAVAVIPAGSTVELVTASGQVGDLHERFLKRWDAAISKVLMGQTLTAELDGKGSYAASDTHMDVAQDIAASDRRIVEQVMNEIAWIYGQINDRTAMCPVFAYEEQKDLKAQAGIDKELHSLGVRFKSAHFERVYGLDPEVFEIREPSEPPETDPEEDLPDEDEDGADFAAPGAAEAPLAPSAPFSVAHRIALEGAVTKALPDAVKSNNRMIADLTDMISQAETWEDARILLAEALGPDLPTTGLEDVLVNMMLGAGSYGQATIMTEQKAGD